MKNAKTVKAEKPVSNFPSVTLGDMQKAALIKAPLRRNTRTIGMSSEQIAESGARMPAPTKGKPKSAREQAKSIVKDVTTPAVNLTKPIKPDTAAKPLLAPVKSLCLVNYAISEYARPKGGAVLFAFTAAWMEMFNMLNGATIKEGNLRQVCGTTAIGYHKRIGNFETNAKGLQLSAQGLNFFNARKTEQKYSDKVKDAFIQIMTTGEIDNVLVKSKSALIKLSA